MSRMSMHWIGLLVVFGLPDARAASPTLPWPAWMAGSWCGTSAVERSEEVWLALAGELMVGLSRTVLSSRTKPQFEFLRVEMRDGVPTYLAQPQGRPAVEFKMVHAGDAEARFENMAHDFPKRIEYRRDGDALRAQISGPGKDGKERVIGFDFVACAIDASKR